MLGAGPVLRVSDATFVREGAILVAPLSLALGAGESVTLAQPDARAAAIAARLCAAIVKPTSGTVYVGDYETRLQPPQAKRLVGFVDAEGFSRSDHSFKCETAFRAEVWGLDRKTAHARAADMLAALDVEESYARAIALALVADVRLVVLDRPPDGAAAAVRALVPQAGIVCAVVSQTPTSAVPLEAVAAR